VGAGSSERLAAPEYLLPARAAAAALGLALAPLLAVILGFAALVGPSTDEASTGSCAVGATSAISSSVQSRGSQERAAPGAERATLALGDQRQRRRQPW
jgi:hypothetical protein